MVNQGLGLAEYHVGIVVALEHIPSCNKPKSALFVPPLGGGDSLLKPSLGSFPTPLFSAVALAVKRKLKSTDFTILQKFNGVLCVQLIKTAGTWGAGYYGVQLPGMIGNADTFIDTCTAPAEPSCPRSPVVLI